VVGPWRVIVVVNALNNGTHFRCVQFRPDSLFTSGIKHSVPVPTLTLPLDGGSYSMSLENVKVISYVTSFPAAKPMNTFSLFSFLLHLSYLPLLNSSNSVVLHFPCRVSSGYLGLYCSSHHGRVKGDIEMPHQKKVRVRLRRASRSGPGITSETHFDVAEFRPDPLFTGATKDTIPDPTGRGDGERVERQLQSSSTRRVSTRGASSFCEVFQ
jgi:hypothetical protein